MVKPFDFCTRSDKNSHKTIIHPLPGGIPGARGRVGDAAGAVGEEVQGVPALQLAADAGDGATAGQAGTGAEGTPLSGVLELSCTQRTCVVMNLNRFFLRIGDRLCRLVIKCDLFGDVFIIDGCI